MTISQRGTSFSSPSSYTLDRWSATVPTPASCTVTQSSVAPVGFTNSLALTVTTGGTVGSDVNFLYQAIEGFNCADLGFGTANAKTITVSFWVRSSVTGSFGGSLRNASGGTFRSYPFSYTISSANTWEQKSVTIAGDTTGTWATNNGAGIYLFFDLGSGAATGTADSWQASNLIGATGTQTALMTTNGATFYITGVQLEVGTQATSFEYRQYQQELALCQRYYYRLKAITATSRFANGFMANTTSGRAMVNFPVPMRSAVTALETSGTGSDYAIFYLAANAVCNAVPIFLNGTNVNTTVIMPTATTLTAGHGVQLAANSINAFLGFSVEL
jgi:hypothetical protein